MSRCDSISSCNINCCLSVDETHVKISNNTYQFPTFRFSTFSLFSINHSALLFQILHLCFRYCTSVSNIVRIFQKDSTHLFHASKMVLKGK